MDLAKTWSVSKYLLYMIYGMFLSSIITIVLYENSLGDSLLRYIVFLPGPLLAILIIKKYRMEPELLDFIMKTTIMFILLASFIQLLAGSLGIEIIEFEHYRKREYIIPQISSIFREPRFMAAFMLPLIIYFHITKNSVYFLLTIFLTVLTQSVTGFAIAAILLTFLAIRVYGFLGIVVIVLSLLVIVSSYDFAALSRVMIFINDFDEYLQFIDYEKISHIDKIGHEYQSSIFYSTVGELLFLIKVLVNAPILGFGIGYDKIEHARTMSLNGFTELIYRFGVVGALLFMGFIKSQLRDNKKIIVFTMLLFLISNGAIAKIEFWLAISLLVSVTNVVEREKLKEVTY